MAAARVADLLKRFVLYYYIARSYGSGPASNLRPVQDLTLTVRCPPLDYPVGNHRWAAHASIRSPRHSSCRGRMMAGVSVQSSKLERMTDHITVKSLAYRIGSSSHGHYADHCVFLHAGQFKSSCALARNLVANDRRVEQNERVGQMMDRQPIASSSKKRGQAYWINHQPAGEKRNAFERRGDRRHRQGLSRGALRIATFAVIVLTGAGDKAFLCRRRSAE